MEKRALESYWEADSKAISKRREQWGHWSDTADHARERQRRHRLLANTRPRELAHRDADPLEIAWEALEHLGRVRQALRANVGARAHLDEAEELVKRLAHGPQSDSRLAKSAGPVFDLTTAAGRMRRNMHRRWHTGPGARPCNCR